MKHITLLPHGTPDDPFRWLRIAEREALPPGEIVVTRNGVTILRFPDAGLGMAVRLRSCLPETGGTVEADVLAEWQDPVEEQVDWSARCEA